MFPKHWSTLRKLIWLKSTVLSGASAVLKTATGNPIHITDALAKPAEALSVAFAPVQSGSGDPSPDNVRPISGWTGLTVYHSGEDTDNPTTIPISWSDSGTVYGGTLDVLTGVLTVEWVSVHLGGISWSKNGVRFDSGYLEAATHAYGVLAVQCECYKGIPNMSGAGFNSDAPDYQICFNSSAGRSYFIVKDPRYSTGSDLKTALNGVYAVYKLKTPQTIQLTPTEVQLLLGENNLWSDANGDLSLTYYADGNADDIESLGILLGNRYVNNHEADEPTDREALDIILGR